MYPGKTFNPGTVKGEEKEAKKVRAMAIKVETTSMAEANIHIKVVVVRAMAMGIMYIKATHVRQCR